MTTFSTACNELLDQMELVLDGKPIARPVESLDQMVFSFDVVRIVDAEPPAVKPATERIQGVNHRKRNKIINNSYKNGDNLKGDEYRFDKVLKVDVSYASSNLSHIYDVENNMVFRKVQEEVMRLLNRNDELQEMLSDSTPKKFNKAKVNRMFKIIYDHFENNPPIKQFSNLIYIFDNISNLSGLKYSSLYDLLDSEYQQIILMELDEHYHIFKTGGKGSKLF